MKKQFIVFLAGCIILSFEIFSQENVIYTNSNTDQDFTLKSSSFGNYQASLETQNIVYKDVSVKGHSFVQLEMEGYVKTTKIGEPELPVFSKIIQIPENAELEIRNLSFHQEKIRLSDFDISEKIKPNQIPVFKSEDPDIHPFQMNEFLYKTDEFYGNRLVKVDILGHLRNFRLARITVSPVEYNPVTNSLRIYTDIEFDLVSKHADQEKTQRLNTIYKSPYFRSIGDKVHGNLLKTTEAISRLPVTYVIISDPMFQETLQPFVEWKRQKGFKVIEAYTNDPSVGDTRGEIKSYLKSLYENATEDDPAPTFGLIVGDIAQVQPFDAESDYHVTDLYFFEYTGDNFPELYYGRMSANSVAELQPQIDKTIEYEKYMMEDPAFLENVLMVAGVDYSYAETYGNGQINYGTQYYFNSENNINSYTYLFPESDESTAAQEIINNVNTGVSFGNYTAHCDYSGWSDPNFSLNDVPGLTNAGKYPTLIGNCCQSGQFDMLACFGEKVLRAENKGAVGYIGASNLSLWDEDYYFGVGLGPVKANPTYEETGLGLYDRLFHANGEAKEDWFITNGQMVVAGNLAVTEAATSYVQYYWEMYHLFGDPSLMTYFGIPDDLEVDYMESFPIGMPEMEIQTEPYTYLALTWNETVISAVEADENGSATIDISSVVEPGEITLYAGKQNHKPFLATISAVPSDSPYVVYKGHSAKDAEGNEKESIHCGDEVYFDLNIGNVGAIDGENIVLKLRTSDIYVQIVDSTEEITSISGGEEISVTNAFSIQVNELVTDQHKSTFMLYASDGNDEWTSTFTITLNAPHILLTDFSIADHVVGNKNGVLDPGEMSMIQFDIANAGHFKATDLEVEISFDEVNVVLFTGQFDLSELEMQTEESFETAVVPSSESEIGEIVHANIHVSAGVYELDTTLLLKVGEFVEDFENLTFETYEWQVDTVHPWTITDTFETVLPYSGMFMAQSGSVSPNESSELTIELDVLTDDSVSFYKKVSCENGYGSKYDFLEFLIDGVSKDFWDGEDDWSYHSYPVAAGNHTFTWRYYKDGWVTEGADRAWIDRVILPVHENSLIDDNHIPEFISTPGVFVHQLEEYRYDIDVTDEDVDESLTISIFEAPEFLSLEENQGQFALSGTPSRNDHGKFDVMLSVTDGKSFNYQSFILEVAWVSSIHGVVQNGLFKVFPNPTSGEIHISITSDTFHTMRICNALGQEIKQYSDLATEMTMDLEQLGKGIYFIELTDGNLKETTRIVITE